MQMEAVQDAVGQDLVGAGLAQLLQLLVEQGLEASR